MQTPRLIKNSISEWDLFSMSPVAGAVIESYAAEVI